MASNVSVDKFDWDDLYQADEYGGWTTGPFDSGHYWNFVAIPAYGNVTYCGITELWHSTDNNLRVTANYTVRFKSERTVGGIFNVKAIRAPAV